MQTKELIRCLSTYDQERDVQIESVEAGGFIRFEIDKLDFKGTLVLICATRTLPWVTFPPT